MSIVAALLLAGCSASGDPAATPSASATPEAAFGADIGVDTWSAPEDIIWAAPDATFKGWTDEAVEASAAVLANWMQTAAFDPTMRETEDPRAAVDLVAASLPPRIGESYTAWRLGNEQQLWLPVDGWSFAPEATVIDSRHAVGWNQEMVPFESGVAAVKSSLMLRSAWFIETEDLEPQWVVTVRHAWLQTDDPANFDTTYFSYNTGAYTLGASNCELNETGRLTINPASYEYAQEAFPLITQTPPQAYIAYDDILASLKPTLDAQAAEQAERLAEEGAPEPTC